MDEKQIESIMIHLAGKGSNELKELLKRNDTSEWVPEAFEAMRRILASRKESAPSGGDGGVPGDDVGILQFRSVGILSQSRSGNTLVTQYAMGDVRKHVIPEVPSRVGRYAAIGAVIVVPAMLLLALLTSIERSAENLGAGVLGLGVIGAMVGGVIGRASTKGIEIRKMMEAAGRERPMQGALHRDFAVVKEDDWEEFRETLR